VLESKGQSLGGQDQDDTIIVPLSTAQKKLLRRTIPGMVRSIMVKARSSEELSVAERQITDLLRQRHRIGPNREDDFTVMNLTQVLEMAEQTANTFALLLGAIASVSLVVGGIGIMNIMLVSVTERTREIGIRMAVGAKTWDIRIQFIVEALTLSMIGGITGIIIGGTASSSCPMFLKSRLSYRFHRFCWHFVFPVWWAYSSVSTRLTKPLCSIRSML
jgi:putative ABC transport system permease protein